MEPGAEPPSITLRLHHAGCRSGFAFPLLSHEAIGPIERKRGKLLATCGTCGRPAGLPALFADGASVESPGRRAGLARRRSLAARRHSCLQIVPYHIGASHASAHCIGGVRRGIWRGNCVSGSDHRETRRQPHLVAVAAGEPHSGLTFGWCRPACSGARPPGPKIATTRSPTIDRGHRHGRPDQTAELLRGKTSRAGVATGTIAAARRSPGQSGFAGQ